MELLAETPFCVLKTDLGGWIAVVARRRAVTAYRSNIVVYCIPSSTTLETAPCKLHQH